MIVQLDYNDITPLISKGRKERVTFDNNVNTLWFGMYDNNVLYSCYALTLSKNTARFKSNYTLPEYRGRGSLQLFIEHAKKICKKYGVKTMTAFCTPLSINSHVNHGAKMYSKKGDITFVKYMIGDDSQ